MKVLLAFLVATLILPPVAWAQAKPGDVAKNLKVIPPWTMRLCPTELHAAYDFPTAKKLKALDNDCWRWRQYFDTYFTMKKSYEKMAETTSRIVASHEASAALDKKRIDSLMGQLKKEIEEKNKYKYKPTWGWIWAVAGGVALAVATGILIGTFATDRASD